MKKNYFYMLLLVLAGILIQGCSAASSQNAEQQQAQETPSLRLLLVGGGSSHDFDEWYKKVDVQTLEQEGNMQVSYTDDVGQILEMLPEIDVLYLANNQPIEDSETRDAIFEFAKQGKGLVLGHAALWYNWQDWPEYNRELVSGGSDGHDPYGEFQVEVKDADHPVMKNVPASFTLADELYYYKEDESGPGIQLLATANRKDGTASFPSVFVVKHPNARIVGIALGHDAASHELGAYKSILINAVNWVGNP